jgi:hypothetical protein
MQLLVTAFSDPIELTVLGAVVGVAFGLSIGVASFLAWLKPQRMVVRGRTAGRQMRASGSVSREAQGLWRLTALRPALRHVWGRPHHTIVVAPPIPKGGQWARLEQHIVHGIDQTRHAVATHASARARLDLTELAVFNLRRDLDALMPAKPAPQQAAAWALPSRRAAFAQAA